MDKKDIKSLRTKELSQMSVQELKDFVKKAESSGFSISKSKELGKAVNLIKAQAPEGYSQKQVESAKTSLQTQSSIPTLERLGIAVPDWKKQQAGISTPIAETAGVTGTAGTMGMTSTTGVSSSPFQTPEVISAQKELDRINKLKTEELAIINDNPFYSEGTRGGKAARLNEKYTQQIANAQTALTTAQTNAQNAYKAQQDALSNNREILKTYISTGALAGATESELVAISKATGYPMGILRGAIKQIQFENQQKLPKAKELTSAQKLEALKRDYTESFNLGDAEGKPLTGDDGYVSPTTWKNLRTAWQQEGGSVKDFNEEFYMYVNPKYYTQYQIPKNLVK